MSKKPVSAAEAADCLRLLEPVEEAEDALRLLVVEALVVEALVAFLPVVAPPDWDAGNSRGIKVTKRAGICEIERNKNRRKLNW